MTVTRADVADLRAGDVVEIFDSEYPGFTMRGPVRLATGNGLPYLKVGPYSLREPSGKPLAWLEMSNYTLTVLTRGPRTLYVNSDRTEPVEGDIVRDCDGDAWLFERGEWFCASIEAREVDDPDGYPIHAFRPLALLWDGATGQVVP